MPVAHERCIVYLVRHAESEVNAGLGEPRDYGPTGSPLSESGREQARDLAARMRDTAIAAFYASDLARARETAEFVAGDAPVATSPELRERFLKPDDELETKGEVVERITHALARIALAHRGERVIVVSHGYAIRAYLVSLGFATFDQLPAGAIEPTGYVILAMHADRSTVVETFGVALAGS